MRRIFVGSILGWASEAWAGGFDRLGPCEALVVVAEAPGETENEAVYRSVLEIGCAFERAGTPLVTFSFPREPLSRCIASDEEGCLIVLLPRLHAILQEYGEVEVPEVRIGDIERLIDLAVEHWRVMLSTEGSRRQAATSLSLICGKHIPELRREIDACRPPLAKVLREP